MQFRFFLIAFFTVFITPNQSTAEVSANYLLELFDNAQSNTDARLNILEKNMTQKEVIPDPHNDLDNDITNLEDMISRLTQNVNDNYKKLENEMLQKMEEHRKFNDMMQKEILYIKTAVCKPSINPSQRNYSIIEINQSATAYNQLVLKKDHVDVSVTWNARCSTPADVATITLNDIAVWSGNGDVTAASFKVRKGGRYQIKVKICNKEACVYSDAAEIVVADTDGSHLPPLEFPIGGTNKQSSGKVVAVNVQAVDDFYKKIQIDRMSVTNVTHLLYNTIFICGGDGINDSVRKLKNNFITLQSSCSGRKDFQVSVMDTRTAVMGDFGQLMMLKRANPDLKILALIGGWHGSDPFYFFSDKTKRDTFVDSVKDFLETWKFFDGIDIKWSFPGGGALNNRLGSSKDGEVYVHLMRELREMLNNISAETAKKYELTSTISSNWKRYKVVDYSEAQKYVDYIFLATYDFYGPQDKPAHEAGIYAPKWNPRAVYTTDDSTKRLIARGVDPKKIVIGVTAHGRGWTGLHDYNSDSPITGKAKGPIKGTIEPFMVTYKEIASEIAQGRWDYHYDNVAKAPYVFNRRTRELISYDDAKSTTDKAKYVELNQLGGLFIRGVEGDNGDLVNAMGSAF